MENYNKNGMAAGVHIDTAKTNNTANVKGELTYDDKVIQKIVGTAVEQIDGLLTVDGGFFSNIAEKLVNTERKHWRDGDHPCLQYLGYRRGGDFRYPAFLRR